MRVGTVRGTTPSVLVHQSLMRGNDVLTQQAVGIVTNDRMNDYTDNGPVSDLLMKEPGPHESIHEPKNARVHRLVLILT